MDQINRPQLDKYGNISIHGVKKTLPPGINNPTTFGNLFLEMGDLTWLTYDGQNFLQDYGKGAKVQDLYAHIRFWGEDPNSRGLYLKFKNGMKSKKETGAYQYKYPVNCPEPSFEQYIDDMGALIIDFYSPQDKLTIGTSKIIVKLYLKREKRHNDLSPLIELRGTFPITMTTNANIKIGEFNLAITSAFADPMTQIPSSVQIQKQINQNQELEMTEDQARQDEQWKLRQETNIDKRIPSSLINRGADSNDYDRSKFEGAFDQRPVRGPAKVRNDLTGKGADSNFEKRKQIRIDENDDTVNNAQELESILRRGALLQQQMARAIEPRESLGVWEELHGIHNVPKTYVPPFMQDQHNKMKEDQEEINIKDKVYELEVEEDAKNKQDSPATVNKGLKLRTRPDYQEHQNLEAFPIEQEDRRQIKDMKFIRIRVKNFLATSDTLIQQLVNNAFFITLGVPLPDIYQKKVIEQTGNLRNYEILGDNLYAFNSLSLYNFRIDEATLSQFVTSSLQVTIPDVEVKGSLSMNQLLLSYDFNLKTDVELFQKVQILEQTKVEGKKKMQDQLVWKEQKCGILEVEINLQSGDTEDEMARNFQIKMQREEEMRAKQEADKQEQTRKKMQFLMEQKPIFAQLYINIDKLGQNDNLGHRTEEQQKEAAENEVNIQIAYDSSLNNRATLTEEKDELQHDLKREKRIVFPKRNLYVAFKAFPNLESIRTNTIWQKDGESEFNYRGQFPVLMSPEAIEKMEKFSMIFELWDQISPSVQEFMGLVKVPLAPITNAIKTTDEEVYSLNFLADNFSMYPMTVCDGFLPIYSPKVGQDIAHLKITIGIGSAVQVNRLIQRDLEIERRRQAEIEYQKIREAEIAKEKELKAARQAKKEKKRQLEAEAKQRELAKEQEENKLVQEMLGGQKIHHKGSVSPSKAVLSILRQSVNSMTNKDYDQRLNSMIDCMRKLFEECRNNNIHELNGEEVFQEDKKNFDGTVFKDEVMFALLNNEKFSLTRIEIASINQMMLDINRDDEGKVDVDELHFSFKSYVKYYELVEQRIIDLLEKFKISITKKFEIPDLIDEFITELESKANESKIGYIQFREILEDRHGIQIRDALYDQLLQFFDLNQSQEIYITSFCEYVRNTSSQKINFFKVNSKVIANLISDFVKNSVISTPNCLNELEAEFKQEIWKQHHIELQKKRGEDPNDPISIKTIPPDLLINEKVNAKLFQYKMKKMGIALSLWEVFTIFESLNTKLAKMYFEPQRYHQIMFANFYHFITNQEYNRISAAQMEPQKISSKHSRNPSKNQSAIISEDKSAPKGSQIYNIEENGYNFGYNDEEDKSEKQGYWLKNEEDDAEDPRRPYKQLKHIFEVKVKELRNIPLLNKFISQSQNQAELNMLFNDATIGKDPRLDKLGRSVTNKYIQNVAVKYSFPLDEDEILESDYLQLNKESVEKQGVYNYTVSMDTVHTYILAKEDDIKNVLKLCQTRGGSNALTEDVDYYHNPNQNRREELFDMSVALYQDNREYIIGNSHLPIEDLIEVISQFESKSGTYDKTIKRAVLSRTLFLYGTTYSQRENCIIGKLQLEVNYSQERIYMTKKEAIQYEKDQTEAKKYNYKGDHIPKTPYSCFMHRETYINRKIPLNAKISVLVDRVSHLKESIENIEHFHKIQHQAIGLDMENEGDEIMQAITGNLASSTMVHNRTNYQHLDRRRVLHHILKHGMNLIVKCSMFDEDKELVRKFEHMSNEDQDALASYGKYQTRMIYNSLNPVFGEVFEMNLQMDTKIFEYLKNKRAVFEIRHYIVESKKQKISKMRASANNFDERICFDDESEDTIRDEDVLSQCDFIVIGYVKVPLLQLITKNNGVDGDFSIFDEFKQKMGSLRLRITLNHHNSQRPLYSTSSKIPNQVQPITPQTNTKQTLIDQSIQICSQMKLGLASKAAMNKKYLLGINFIELILKNKLDLTKHVQGQIQRFYLKFKMNGKVFQTKFVATDFDGTRDQLNLLLMQMRIQRFEILKTSFIELNMTDQSSIEEAFGKPLEIQLWHKIESLRTYEKPICEKMIGQFYVELNELSKITNHRIKEFREDAEFEPGRFQAFEGFFSMHSNTSEKLSSDRLAMRIYLFHQNENFKLDIDEMNTIFNHYRSQLESQITQKLDPSGTGYTELEDLITQVSSSIPEESLAVKMKQFIKSSLEFKSVDKVYYSPLFGLPPPFFKYSNKFDNIEIICRFNEEFEHLDSQGNGYVPANVFKNLLEGELNLKSKIVEDFMNSIRDIDIENQNPSSHAKIVKEVQTLDVNLVTNSLKTSHIDYMVLIRKLSQWMNQNQKGNNIISLKNKKILDMRRELEHAQEVVLSFEVDSGMRLANPLSSTEQPNCYVLMKPNFQTKEESQFVQTNVIKQNSYPMWNYKSYNFSMPLNSFNVDFLNQGTTLEFEVYHKAIGANSNNINVQESNHLIGVAYVPLKGLLDGNGKTRLTGMYDVVNKNAVFQSIQSTTSLSKLNECLGKVKIVVNASMNIKKFLDGKEDRTYEQPFTYDVQSEQAPNNNSQALSPEVYHRKYQQELNRSNYGHVDVRTKVEKEFDDAASGESESIRKLKQDLHQYKENLQSATEDQIALLHTMNMEQLENLNAKLKSFQSIFPENVNGNIEESKQTVHLNQQSFGGHKTFKTDIQRSNLETQMKLETLNTANPFRGTQNFEEEDDITRHEEASSLIKAEQQQTKVQKKESPTFKHSDLQLQEEDHEYQESQTEVENVFRDNTEQLDNEQTFYDEEEMKRIAKILKS